MDTCCSAGAAERSNADAVGALFLAHIGRGAYVSSLWASPSSNGSSSSSGSPKRIQVEDCEQLSAARFMESYESRHSNHSFTAQVVSQGRTGRAVAHLHASGSGMKGTWCCFC
jgi:hypothetical protein